MKNFFGLLIMISLVASASGQSGQNAKVIAELSASSEKIVRNSPFSAEAVSESVQTLADGNRIVHSSTSKLYRNGEGRFRREFGSGMVSPLGASHISLFGSGHAPAITILDPVVGYRYQLDTHLKTARQAPLHRVQLSHGKSVNADVLKERAVALERLKGELRVVSPAAVVALPHAATVTATGVGGGMNFGVATPGFHSKYESRTENLGTQNIEGVEAEGTRSITTIPAGAIGNEQPIEIVYERWYSNDLQLVVMSKRTDPRFGEQTYRLTNINRSEPDPSLFSLPTGYKLIPSSSAVYNVGNKKKVDLEKAAAAKASQSGRTVVKTNP